VAGKAGTNESPAEELKEEELAPEATPEEPKAEETPSEPAAEETEKTEEPEATEEETETPEDKAERLAQEVASLTEKLGVTEANRIALQKNLETARSTGPTVAQLLGEIDGMKRSGRETQALMMDYLDAIASGKSAGSAAPTAQPSMDEGGYPFDLSAGPQPAATPAATPQEGEHPFPTPRLDAFKQEEEAGQTRQRSVESAVGTVQTMLDLAGMPIDSVELEPARMAMQEGKTEEGITIAKDAIVTWSDSKRKAQEEELEQRGALLALRYLADAGLTKQDSGGPTAAPSNLDGMSPLDLAEKAYSKSK